MKQSTIKELKPGDIYRDGPNSWDSLRRLHSLHFYNDKTQKWQDEWSENCRTCIWLLSPWGTDDYGGVFTWRDIDKVIYIPQFDLSNHKKSFGRPCMTHGDNHTFFYFSLNSINLSFKFTHEKTNILFSKL